jgi:plasmid stabilization system protein ParE
MPRGDKSSYTSKQKRQAEHIEEGYEKRGVSKGEAERRAWATVNERTGGGKKGGGKKRAAKKRSSPARKRSAGARKRAAGGARKRARGRG